MSDKQAVIIGAGPAGLTAAYELLTRTGIKPIVLECSEYMGGISRTVQYNGNRIDIGGHRFFSKSDRVMDWWFNILPMATMNGSSQHITYQKQSREVHADSDIETDPEKTDDIMFVRPRKSRVYYMRKFFDYPITLSKNTVMNLGLFRTMRIGFSYMKSMMFPIRKEQNLEQFFINRFGKELYHTFFKSYTEKVWGVKCDEISAEWGAQRIKGLSIRKALGHAAKSVLKSRAKNNGDVAQKDTETSLIEQFLYPKYGPGQMWETVAKHVEKMGGTIITHQMVDKINVADGQIASIEAVDTNTGERTTYEGEYFFSTMPVKDLINGLNTNVPQPVKDVANGLVYRDFITVGLLLDELKIKEDRPDGSKLIRDTWVYIQEPDVIVGRLQIFNNWSEHMISDPSKVWLGLEYFCYETDDIWKLPDNEMIELGKTELDKIGIIDKSLVRDACVIRMPKTYPAYFGTYDQFDQVRDYIGGYDNLFLIGRNGMHRYNNQDHSMLTAMTVVDNLIDGKPGNTGIWDVNAEQEYHEEKKAS